MSNKGFDEHFRDDPTAIIGQVSERNIIDAGARNPYCGPMMLVEPKAYRVLVTNNECLCAALRSLHDAVDQQTAYAIRCHLEVIDYAYIMTKLSEARAALAKVEG